MYRYNDQFSNSPQSIENCDVIYMQCVLLLLNVTVEKREGWGNDC